MDEKFTQEEQTAVANVLYNLVHADFNDHAGEDDCLKACFDELGFDAKGFVPTPKSELPAQAYETLKKMPLEKKRTFSRMMTQIARSDGHFGPREQAFVKEILDYCDVPFVQR